MGSYFACGEQQTNEETRDVFEKTDREEELVECEDADDMFKKLNI